MKKMVSGLGYQVVEAGEAAVALNLISTVQPQWSCRRRFPTGISMGWCGRSNAAFGRGSRGGGRRALVIEDLKHLAAGFIVSLSILS